MPNIPTYTRRDPRRVIGPALTDPSGARVASDAPARGAVAKAQGEQDMWRGVQKLGIDVTNFVNQKITENETFKDNNARIKAATRRKVTEREFELFKQTHHSSQWAEEWQRLSSDAVADQDTYEYGTSKGRQTDLGVSQGWMSIGGARAAASAASAYKTETISNQERMLAVAAAEYGQDDIRTKREIEAYRDILDEVQAGTPKGTVDIAIGRILETSQKQYEAALEKENKDLFRNGIAGVKMEAAKENPDGTMVHDAEERAKMFDELRDDLQTTTLVSADESQKALQSLNQYEKTLNGRAAQVSLQNTLNYYDQNQDRLFNNEMDRDETDEFDFHDDEGRSKGSTARDYGDYIEGAAEIAQNPVPYDTKEGVASVMDAVLNYSMKSIDSKVARDDIYIPTLVDQNVTKATAEWALNKIRDPFPPAFAEDLKGVVDANYDTQRSIFNVKSKTTEDTEAAAINRSLMIWADENTTKSTDAEGNVSWKTPSLDALEEQSAQYRAILSREGIGALGGIGASKQDAELEELGLADEVPSPITAEEYSAVPSGVWYQHPDDPEGTLRKKP